MKADKEERVDPAIFGEVQMILAEKRTALASLRTGIAVFALPLSVLSLLVATSRYYEPSRVLHFLIPLLALSAALALFGAFLIVHSMRRIRRYDHWIAELKERYKTIGHFIQ
jgi:uncharacterized membrane protein YidH (DUF202 family)